MSPALLLILSLPFVGWSTYSKLKRHSYYDAWLVAYPALAALVSALIFDASMAGRASLTMLWIQMFLSATIIPLAYLYFSQQIGRQFNNGTNILLWTSLLLLFIPKCVIFLPGQTSVFDSSQLHPFAIRLVQGLETKFAILTGDLIIVIQALITMMRIVPMTRKLRRYGLKLDQKIYAFVIWWVMTIIFIATISLSSVEALSSTLGKFYYFGGLTLLISTIHLLIALHFDLHPVKTEEGDTVQNVGSYIEHQSALMVQVRHIVEVDRVYLQPGYRTEDILKALATNRTYFTRMMQDNFGKTFSQYLNEHRLAHAQHLLLTTDLTQSEIALQSGFNEVTYMSRMFKSTYNLTPRQWQVENRTTE